MVELSMHILDIVENSTRAGATMVTVRITEDRIHDTFIIDIIDNGRGMDNDTLRRALDPFFTTKSVRRIGLGLPMLQQAAKSTEGLFSVDSKEGVGTKVTVSFKHSHIDRQPLGDMPGTMVALITGTPEVDFIYEHHCNSRTYLLDTREIKKELEGIPLNTPQVLNFIKQNIKEGLEEVGAGN
jgi:hypothetical protein